MNSLIESKINSYALAAMKLFFFVGYKKLEELKPDKNIGDNL